MSSGFSENKGLCTNLSFRGRTSQGHPTIASQRTPENVYVGGEPNDDFLSLSIPPRCIENTF